jgi:hypothetical protein
LLWHDRKARPSFLRVIWPFVSSNIRARDDSQSYLQRLFEPFVSYDFNTSLMGETQRITLAPFASMTWTDYREPKAINHFGTVSVTWRSVSDDHAARIWGIRKNGGDTSASLKAGGALVWRDRQRSGGPGPPRARRPLCRKAS